jgi:hypothetical protein
MTFIPCLMKETSISREVISYKYQVGNKLIFLHIL